MKSYTIRQAKKNDGSENDDKTKNERVDACSPRAARRKYRKRHGLHPTHELVCE